MAAPVLPSSEVVLPPGSIRLSADGKTARLVESLPTHLQVAPGSTMRAMAEDAIRYHRWDALRLLWSWSSLRSVRQCTRNRIDREAPVGLGTSDGRPSVVGVQTCGNIHACPKCAPKVRSGRADEIRQAVEKVQRAGGEALFLTLTVPHDDGMSLRGLWNTVAETWTGFTGSRLMKSWKKLGLIGSIRALEVTHGSSGWHPHLHVLVLFDAPLSGELLTLFREDFGRAWCDGVEARGWRRPSRRHGVKIDRVRIGTNDLGRYVTKIDGGRIDAELARADLKEGRWHNRSPWMILRDIHSTAEKADLDLWWEYEQASFRKNAITWSHGLKKKLGIVSRSDQEIAAESTGHVTMLNLYGPAWGQLCAAGAATACMSLVRSGDRHGVAWLLDVCGIDPVLARWVDDDDGLVPSFGHVVRPPG